MLKLSEVLQYSGLIISFNKEDLFTREIMNNQAVIKSNIDVSNDDECQLHYNWYYYGDNNLREFGESCFADKDWLKFCESKDYEEQCEDCGGIIRPFPPEIYVYCKDRFVGLLPMVKETFDAIDTNEYEHG